MTSTDTTDRTISCTTCGDRFHTIAESIDHLTDGICARAIHHAVKVACARVARRISALESDREPGIRRLVAALDAVTIAPAGPRRLRATITPGHSVYASGALDTGLDIYLADPRIGIAQDIADKAEIIVVDRYTHELVW